MKNFTNFFITLAGACLLFVLSNTFGFIESQTKAVILSFALSSPWQIGKNIYSVFGGGVRENGGVYSLVSFYQRSETGPVVSLVSIGYQRSTYKYVFAFVCLGKQVTHSSVYMVLTTIGIVAQSAKNSEVSLWFGIAILQDAYRKAKTFIGIQVYARALEIESFLAIRISSKPLT